MDDLGSAIAWLGADLESAESDYNQMCSTYPESCFSPRGDEFTAGPSLSGNCSEQAGDALVAFVSGVGAYLGIEMSYQGAVQQGMKLTKVGTVALYGSIFAVGFAVGFYTAAYVDCLFFTEPAAGRDGLWSRPEGIYPAYCAG